MRQIPVSILGLKRYNFYFPESVSLGRGWGRCILRDIAIIALSREAIERLKSLCSSSSCLTSSLSGSKASVRSALNSRQSWE